MLRREEHIVCGPDFDDGAQIHDRHAVGDVAHHCQVVGNEQQREAKRTFQFTQQIDDLRLHGNVEGRDRLVADDELWTHDERPGDADALSLAAGEFVGVATPVVAREPHPLKHLLHFGVGLAAAQSGVQAQALADDFRDGHTRIQ